MTRKIRIEKKRMASEISDDFNNLFPFLKLGFFKRAHGAMEPSMKKEMIDGSTLVGEISNSKKDGMIDIHPAMTVGEFETLMRVEFGLNIHVFRKSGNVWLETTTTDHLTITSQNALGQEKSTPVEKTDITDIDYD